MNARWTTPASWEPVWVDPWWNAWFPNAPVLRSVFQERVHRPGRSWIPVGGGCDDGDDCTSNDACQADHTCVVRETIDDGNPARWMHVTAPGACPFRTPRWRGWCVPRRPAAIWCEYLCGDCVAQPGGGSSCDDGNPCTTEECDEIQGCILSSSTELPAMTGRHVQLTIPAFRVPAREPKPVKPRPSIAAR